MTDYNKIITTVNSITPDYQFIPDLNNTIVIDTSENRIGINTITPDENIHVSGGTIKTQNLIVLGDLSINNIASDLIPGDDLSYNLGSIDYRWNDLFIGPGSVYMDKTRIIRMGDYTRHGANDISALIIDNSGKHLDISDIRHVNIEGDVSINKHVDIKEQLTVLSDVSFMSKFIVIDDSSFNSNVDVSGILHIKKTNNNGLVIGTKIYTVYENNSAGNPTTRLIIDPSGNGITGSVAEQGEVVIMGNLDVKGTSTFIKSTNVDICDNIIRMNANHNSVTHGGIAVKNSSNVDKLFTYNNQENYWTTHDTNINFGPNGGVFNAGFMNIDKVNIDDNTIDVDSGDLVLKSNTGQVVVENITFNSNTISTNSGLDLNLTADGGNIFTQNSNLNLGNGNLTINGVTNSHVPAGAIVLWFGDSNNVPTGWVICDGNNGTPNLSGRFVVCSGTNSEHTYTPGQKGGKDDYTLSTNEIPSHNHQASSLQAGDPHNHNANSTNTDVIHNHIANSSAIDVAHDHNANTSITSTVHQATSLQTQHTHEHEHTHQAAHTHTVGDNLGAHTHNAGQHSHDITGGHHIHNNTVSVETKLSYKMSKDEAGSQGFISILTDDQNQVTVQQNVVTQDTHNSPPLTTVPIQVDSQVQVVNNSAAPENLEAQQSGADTGVAKQWNPNVEVNESSQFLGGAINTQTGEAETQTGQGGVAHNHQITHDVITTTIEQSAPLSHVHPIDIQQSISLSHNHEVIIDQETIQHEHTITIETEGGGNSFDNRPKWYSLWYIMKL